MAQFFYNGAAISEDDFDSMVEGMLERQGYCTEESNEMIVAFKSPDGENMRDCYLTNGLEVMFRD